MKNENGICVRYTGPDHARRFCLQRADHTFWNGDRWVEELSEAKLYKDHKTAQAACSVLQYDRYKGKPVRSFNINMVVTLVADDVENISRDDLIKYITTAMRIDLETSVYGDGPTDTSFVAAKLQTQTLTETAPIRPKW